MPGFWNRLTKRLAARRAEGEAEEEQMSPPERRFVEQGAEDRQAELNAEAHFGGIEPERFLDDEEGRPD